MGEVALVVEPLSVLGIQASASVNRLIIAACDRAGSESGMSWVGASTVVNVDGQPLASAWPPGGSTPTIIYADCDLARASSKDVGPYNNIHTDRRPSLYHCLSAEPDDRERPQ